ncbi:pre-mRNA-processing factor 40, partial [Tremellales sp. Uapishka_1]
MSASPVPTGKSSWSEYKNAEGRVYWSHAVTKQSVWEKPDELRTPFEKALLKTNWKQYTSKDRPYYVNSATKETKWDLPVELKQLKERIDAEEAFQAERERRREAGEASPTPPPRSRSSTPDHLQASSNNALAHYAPTPSSTSLTTHSGLPSQAPKETIAIPMGGFLTHDKAVEAFMFLLKREGIDESQTWDMTMRKIIMDPLYKALDTMSDKKKAYEQHLENIRTERNAVKNARIAKLRPILHRLFGQSGEIKSYSTIKTANRVFARDRHWREAQIDEQRLILEEFVDDVRKQQEAAERALKTKNLQTLSALVRNLDITVSTRWRSAHDIILSSPAFRSDPDLQKVETLDILTVYDDYSRQLEREHEESTRRSQKELARKGRKAREGFKSLLSELQQKGDLTRSSKWKETIPKIRTDERYLNLLGLPGSSPLDLWMDTVDDLNEEVERAAEKVERGLEKAGLTVTVDVKVDAFDELVIKAGMEGVLEERLRKDVYALIHERLVQAKADDERRAERKKRHAIDDLRYALRKVQRHIDLEMTYEEAVPHMKDLAEFKNIAEDQDRKAAFEKYIRRQKEKMREAESSDVGSARGDKQEKSRHSSSRMEVDEPEGDRKERRHRDERDHQSKRRDEREDREDKKDRGERGERERKHPKGSVEPDDRERETKRPRRASIDDRKGRREEVEEGEI